MVRTLHESLDNLLKSLIAKRVCDMVNRATSSLAGAGIAFMFRCAGLR